MSKKSQVAATNPDQDFIDAHEGFTREQVFEYPKTPLLMKIYIEDKYMVLKNPDIKFDELKQKIKDNNFYCLSKPKSKDNRCMCEQFLMSDCEGPCQCGLYTKKLRDNDSFEKIRVASLKRQSGKSLFKDE